MKVECPSCGSVVEIPAFPGWCPNCSHRIASIVPLLTSTTPRPAPPEPVQQLDDVQSQNEAFSPVPSSGLGNTFPTRIVRNVLIGLACVLGLVVLIDYVFLKSRAIVSSNDEKTPATKSVKQDWPQSAPAPAPAPTPQQPFPPNPPPPPPVALVPVPPPEPPSTTTAPVAATQPARPRIKPVRAEVQVDGVTDAAINDAIQRGVTYLIGRMKSGAPEAESSEQQGGIHALVVLALLHAGEATFDERLNLNSDFMRGLLDNLKRYPLDTNFATYSRSLRAAALAVRDRKEDRLALAADLQWLLKAAVRGSYTYTLPPENTEYETFNWDNSNSQYGALGVWAAADAGLTVPPSYWVEVEKHWASCANPNGGWDYKKGGSPTLAMTSAGLTMMFVAHDQLNAQRTLMKEEKAGTRPQQQQLPQEKENIEPYPVVVARGLRWLSAGDNAVRDLGHFPGYTLYGLERAGLASGFKMFGAHDWYREQAAKVLAEQDPKSGSWGGNMETAFRILFLSRGRHPILMNKLRFDGAWANRPRDLVRLTRFVFGSIERPLNWQVVNLSEPWETWMDAPVLYLASHESIELTDEDVNKLRAFTTAGGLLFTHADADSRKFNDFARQLAARLYHPLQPLPPEHVIYSSMYTPKSAKVPPLEGVSNGARLLMVHSPTDLASKWQFRDVKSTPAQFELGANIFIYATGKHPLRNRLDTPLLPEVKGAPIATVGVARVKHAGTWDPEPAAWPRFARYFQAETSIELTPQERSHEALSSQDTPVAHLTSTAAFNATDAELTSLRRYVEDGGVLLIDACGGSPQVAKSLRENVLAKLFANATAKPIGDDHPLLAGAGEGMDHLDRPRLRVFAVEKMKLESPRMQIVEAGEGAVIFSDLDLVSGLLGTTTWGIAGYEPTYAQSFMKNLVLWTMNRRDLPVSSPPTAP